jgi:hypothetical protein
MAPIYDSDLAEERYSKEEWNRYELWERIELRLRRRRRLWILAASIAFVGVSSIPIVLDRLPKWRSLAATRRLAEELNSVKRDAIQAQAAYRLRFLGGGRTRFVVERLASCSADSGVEVRTGDLLGDGDRDYAVLSPRAGEALGTAGFSEAFCYDYLSGSGVIIAGGELSGFGVIPVNDLTTGRYDRLSVLLVSGPSAEISFE